MRGTAEECFKHYASRLPPVTIRANHASRNPIIGFCQVGTSTIRRWINGAEFPKGSTFLRLCFFLEAWDYEVVEIRELSRFNRQLAEVIAYDAVSMTEAVKDIGYRNPQTLLGVLRGKHEPMAKQRVAATTLVRSVQPTLEKRRQSYQVKGFIPTERSVPRDPATIPSLPSPELVTSPSSAFDRQTTIKIMAGLVNGALPLAKVIADAPFTPADRALLHQLTYGNGVYNLMHALKRLCSETANRSLAEKNR